LPVARRDALGAANRMEGCTNTRIATKKNLLLSHHRRASTAIWGSVLAGRCSGENTHRTLSTSPAPREQAAKQISRFGVGI
jgi:hypothetical protein